MQASASYSKVTVVRLLNSMIEFVKILLLTVYNLIASSLRQDSVSQHGGKIDDQANVLSNVSNTMNRGFIQQSNYIIRCLRLVECKLVQATLIFERRPIITLVGQKLNSSFLRTVSTKAIAPISVQDQSNKQLYNTLFNKQLYNTLFKTVRCRLGVVPKVLPSGKDRNRIYEEVFKEQMALVRLAQKHGLQSKELFKKQLLLLRSLNFRIVALDKLSKSPGSNTPGIDGVSLSNSELRNKILVELLTQLRDHAYHPNKYSASPVKRV
jgi:hypothetical protein